MELAKQRETQSVAKNSYKQFELPIELAQFNPYMDNKGTIAGIIKLFTIFSYCR